jgi:hypothetical protein
MHNLRYCPIICLEGLMKPRKPLFYDRVTVHRSRFLVNKTNRCTEFQFYWYYYSTFLVNDQRDAQIPVYVFIFIFNSLHISSTSCSSSGETGCVNTTSSNCHSVLVAVSCAGWQGSSSLLLVANASSQLHKMYLSRCTAKNS